MEVSTVDRGKREWLQAAIQTHGLALHRYAARITGSTEVARDVVQETFLKLWSASSPPAQEKLPEWLFRVCRNHAIDLNRKNHSTAPFAPEELERKAGRDQAPSPAEAMGRNEETQRLSQAVGRLSQVQQEILRLKFQHDMSYRQIGSILSLTVSHVGVLLHAAVQELRRQMPRS